MDDIKSLRKKVKICEDGRDFLSVAIVSTCVASVLLCLSDPASNVFYKLLFWLVCFISSAAALSLAEERAETLDLISSLTVDGITRGA